ncbi:echinoidin-like [Patiria miniata]|uniref:C-type lectin domain-containing protein n=1 Tax=Patiria miniata TaxID=46514 RepID=A0A914A6S2_PATMI|nr:echinoidin-like [Patiria miniata]
MYKSEDSKKETGFTGLLVLILASVSLSSDGSVAALCSSPYCQPPWLAFQGHCYLWVDKPMSWMDAERHCQMLSHPGKMVHLASIHSKEEDEFIKDYVRSASGLAVTPSYWIGCNDIERESNFQWSDASYVSYKSWAPGEPNSDVGEEDCVECRSNPYNEWNDLPCNLRRSLVCKH